MEDTDKRLIRYLQPLGHPAAAEVGQRAVEIEPDSLTLLGGRAV